MPSKISPSCERIVLQYAGKLPDNRVAALAGCCANTVLSIRKRHGIKCSRHIWTASENRQLIALHNCGMSFRHLARKFGTDVNNLRTHLRQIEKKNSSDASIAISKMLDVQFSEARLGEDSSHSPRQALEKNNRQLTD